ncbi:MAG: hypothetical protein M3Q39_14410 [Actinomycetota bacterium]|nr:hypothetical protein [Actinomycetota bacterium]
MSTSDPLFPTTALLPLSAPGGVQVAIPHIPESLRPFIATLGVPWQLDDAKKHDTSATKSTYKTGGKTINDGTESDDSVVDSSTDD